MTWLAAIPIVGDIIKAAENILDQYVVDKDKALEGKVKLKELEMDMTLKVQQMAHEEAMNMTELNKLDAVSTDKFASRARPFTLWTCNAALVYTFILYPLGQWYCALKYPTTVLPELPNVEYLFVLMSALLGIGGMRSFDKWKVQDGTNKCK